MSAGSTSTLSTSGEEEVTRPVTSTSRLPPRSTSPAPLVATSPMPATSPERSEEHTSELQSRENLVCRLLLEKKKLIVIRCCINIQNKINTTTIVSNQTRARLHIK